MGDGGSHGGSCLGLNNNKGSALTSGEALRKEEAQPQLQWAGQAFRRQDQTAKGRTREAKLNTRPASHQHPPHGKGTSQKATGHLRRERPPTDRRRRSQTTPPPTAWWNEGQSREQRFQEDPRAAATKGANATPTRSRWEPRASPRPLNGRTKDRRHVLARGEEGAACPWLGVRTGQERGEQHGGSSVKSQSSLRAVQLWARTWRT